MTDIDFVRPPCKVLLDCRRIFHTLRCPGCSCRCNWSLCRCNSGRQGTRMRDPLKRPSKRSSWLLSLLQGSIKTNRSRSARSYPGDVRHHVRCRAADNARLTDGPPTHASADTCRVNCAYGVLLWTSTPSSGRFRVSRSAGRSWPFSEVRGRPLLTDQRVSNGSKKFALAEVRTGCSGLMAGERPVNSLRTKPLAR